tara:strand:+ start:760 stop:1005 length:246 start_codon:yes stop_codon:yes gene_type:complete
MDNIETVSLAISYRLTDKNLIELSTTIGGLDTVEGWKHRLKFSIFDVEMDKHENATSVVDELSAFKAIFKHFEEQVNKLKK